MTSISTALTHVLTVPLLQHILVIEHDTAIQADLKGIFESEGYAVETAFTGEEGLKLFRNTPPTVLLLDVQLADTSGRQLFEKMHYLNPSVPIIVLGAKSRMMEPVLFLELGAHDYVVKPVNGRELLARVRAAMRRSAGSGLDVFVFGNVRVDFRKMEVSRQGVLVPLTAQEFKVLRFMIHNAERAIRREELLNEVWGYQHYPTTRTVDNHILRLRQKLEAQPSHPVHFLTLQRIGYKFVPTQSSAE